jgi:Spy/CpxP family protein refolding chaperone
MTHIRSALAAGMLLFGSALVASAQAPQAQVSQAQTQGQHAKGHRGKHGSQLMKGISLSATEKANVKSVHGKYASQLKALRAQGKSDATREQAKQLMASERADLRNALSSGNQAKFDANVAQFNQRVAQRKAKSGRPGSTI